MTIKIYISLIVLIIYNLFVGRLESFLIFYGFIIMHEFAHIIIAILLNVDIVQISFMPVGVNAKYSGNVSLFKELIISIAGPIASLIFAFLYSNKFYFMVNMCILIFNIIPIYPLDGGRILKIILIFLFGYKKGKSISLFITNVLVFVLFLSSLFLAAYYKSFFLLFATIYILRISRKEIQKEKIIDIINYLQIDN